MSTHRFQLNFISTLGKLLLGHGPGEEQMDKQEVIQAAAQMEKDGRAFYLEAAGKATNPAVREVLEHLAADELKHIEWIDEVLGPHDAGKEARGGAYDRLKHVFKEMPAEDRDKVMASESDLDPLRKALEFENRAVKAYAQWAEELSEADVREMCIKLVEVEKFHAELIDNTILFLENPAEYFQKEEGWMLDGG
jgi:rubrerythrin